MASDGVEIFLTFVFLAFIVCSYFYSALTLPFHFFVFFTPVFFAVGKFYLGHAIMAVVIARPAWYVVVLN